MKVQQSLGEEINNRSHLSHRCLKTSDIVSESGICICEFLAEIREDILNALKRQRQKVSSSVRSSEVVARASIKNCGIANRVNASCGSRSERKTDIRTKDN